MENFENSLGRVIPSAASYSLPLGPGKRGEETLVSPHPQNAGRGRVRQAGADRGSSSSPLVGEGGAATSLGQATGAGTAFPLRRNPEQMVSDLTSAMLIADLSLLVAWQRVRGIGDPVEAHRDMVDKETGRTQEPPEDDGCEA